MLELLTVAAMAEADRRTIAAGTPGATLMDRAGLAVADAVARRAKLGLPVVVACGPGNNGGDGFVAARVLANRGYPVRVILVGELSALRGDAAAAAGRWRGPVETPRPGDVDGAAVIVDALFGAGLARPIEGAAADLIARIAAARTEDGTRVPVVAVDLPSGIQGDTGAVLGRAVTAVETVTFARRKPGHLLMPGRMHCGRVRIADIGIDDATIGAVSTHIGANDVALWADALAVPTLAAHKYTRGHAVVVSGPHGRTGAARLAARAALRAGAGLVTVASPPDALAENAGASTAVMVREVADGPALAALLADGRFRTVALGPALGTDARARGLVDAALAAGPAVVLDADALGFFADDVGTLRAAIDTLPDRPVVLTPHAGEFARLFKNAPEVLRPKSKVDQARLAAAATGATVVFKGADTVVAGPDGTASIADNAPPWLATAGAGDVLAGLVAGLLAQGLPVFAAASAAVWLHGAAGQAAGPGLIAEDLPDALPQVLRALYERLEVDFATGRRP